MPAGAHALLRETDPAAGSSLDQAPRRVVLTFTERPEPGLTSIAVLDTGGQPVQRGEGAPVEGEPLQFAVGLGDLADGTYTVSWRVVSRDDGHVTAGSFAFGVGVPAPAATPRPRRPPRARPSPRRPRPPPPGWPSTPGSPCWSAWPSPAWPSPGGSSPRAPGCCWPWPPPWPSPAGSSGCLAEKARIDAPLGTLLDSSTGQGLLRLVVGVVVTAVAVWFLAAARPGPPGPRRGA